MIARTPIFTLARVDRHLGYMKPFRSLLPDLLSSTYYVTLRRAHRMRTTNVVSVV